MSEKTVTVCDLCGKRVDDPYEVEGSIEIGANSSGSFSIRINGGRSGDGVAQSLFFRGRLEELWFCSLNCLVKYLKQRDKKVKKL
jgi:hypothetical protein